MDGAIHIYDDSVTCKTCTKCYNDCASSPDSKVHDCPDYEQKLSTIKIPDAKPKDEVNHPDHYTQGGIECIDCIRASMSAEGFQDYCKGNVIKYIHRWRFKGGVQDLKKAKVYLDWLIESAERSAAL